MDGAARRLGGRSHGATARTTGRPDAVYALDIDTGDYYSVADPGGLRGSGAGYWTGVVFIVDSAPATTSYLAASGAIGSTGWQLRISTGPAILGRGHDGVGGNVDCAASGNVTAGSNIIHAALMRHDGTDLQLWVDSVATDGGTALTGLTASAQTHVIGASSTGSSECTTCKIVSHCGGDNVQLTDAEISAWFTAVRSGRGIATIPSKTDHLWHALGLSDGPASLTDRVGSDDMTEAGAVAVGAVYNPLFAW